MNDLTYPFVTAAIVAFNRREELRVTLQATLQDLDYPSDRLEIIVVDNASTDGTVEMLRSEFPQVTVIPNSVNEGAPAWNRAFRIGRGDYYLILDDDCHIAGSSLKEAVQAAREHGADLVSFRISAPGADEDFSFNAVYNPGLLSFWGCAAVISRRAVERLGGYDPNIFCWGNEADLTMRLLDAGLKHLYLPTVVACHYKRPFTGETKGIALNPFAETTSRTTLGYIAGKALRPVHAVTALINLVLYSCARFYHHRSFAALFAFARANIAGFVRGLLLRQPVSKKVSRIYKENFADFANALVLLARRPGRPRFWAERPQFYPKSVGSLEVTPED